MPTILDMANIEHPNKYNGKPVAKMRGRSLTGLLSGEKEYVYSNTEIVAGEMANGHD